METEAVSIPLHKIEKSDRSFIITAGRDNRELTRSIQQVGLVNLPYLVAGPSGDCYRIVCGCRRIQVLTELGWKEVTAKIFSNAPEEKTLFLFAFFDNLAHRQFNPVEKAHSVERLLHYFSQEEIIRSYLPLLGLHPTARTLADTISLAGLEDDIKYAVITGALQEKTAVRLAGLSAEERQSIFSLFCMVNLSASKQSEISEHCLDIACRDSLSISEILDDRAVQDVLQQDRMTGSQKGEQVRQVLRKKRFPRLTRREESFGTLKKRMHLPPNLVLSPPAFFEGAMYRMQISFETVEDVQAAADQVKKLAENPDLKKLLEG